MPNTDNQLLLRILEASPGEWMAHDHILTRARLLSGHGLTVHSRAADLRKPPWSRNVECEVRHVDGRRRSYYRITTPDAETHLRVVASAYDAAIAAVSPDAEVIQLRLPESA